MERYNLQHEIGQGSFGTVHLAIKKDTGSKVAIKRFKGKYQDWNRATKLREVQAMVGLLRKTSRQPRKDRQTRENQQQTCETIDHYENNIVQTYEVIREMDNSLYLVFEYMPDGNLNDFLSNKRAEGHKTIDTTIVQSILCQVVKGLAYIHSKGYVHRDVKPENLLLRGMECKVADFSLTRLVSSKGRTNVASTIDEEDPMTTYVSTRWYRAPEVILGVPHYSTKVDMFAVGCVMAELYRLCPLFPGHGEVDQLHRILDLMGPLSFSWPDGVILSQQMGLNPHFQDYHGADANGIIDSLTIAERLQNRMPSATPTAISLAMYLLQVNPTKRVSAEETLHHAFFGAASQMVQSRPLLGKPTLHGEKPDEHSNLKIATTPQRLGLNESVRDRIPLVSVSPSFRNNISSQKSLAGLIDERNLSDPKSQARWPRVLLGSSMTTDNSSSQKPNKRCFSYFDEVEKSSDVQDTAKTPQKSKKVARTPAEFFDVH